MLSLSLRRAAPHFFLALLCTLAVLTARLVSAAPITFVEPNVLPAPAMATDNQHSFIGVAKGDFNGDGKLDFAATYIDHANYNNYGQIEIALGNGNGTFATPAVIKIPLNASGGEVDGGAILAKDFNGDGKLDLAVATTNSTVLIYPGKGDGTFGTPISVALPANANSLQAGDVNGDGKLDLAALIPSTNQVAVLLGAGSGTFAAPVLYTVDANASDMALADVDRKNGLDIVVAAGVVDCLLNNGNGTFAAKRTSAAGSKDLLGLYVADFDGDGKPDVVAAGSGGVADQQGYHGNSFVFLKGVGDGTFLSPATTNDFSTNGDNPTRFYTENVTPDLNGDGHADVVFASEFSNTLTIGYGDGKGNFSLSFVAAGSGSGLPNTNIEGATPNGFVFGSFTGHPLPDILVSSYSTNDGPGGLNLIRANPVKPGAFLSASLYSTGDANQYVGGLDDLSFALGDFLHNGTVSLAALGSENNGHGLYFHGIDVVPGLGDGTFTQELPYPLAPIMSGGNDPSPANNYELASADFNGDGLPDLLYDTAAGYNNSPLPFETLTFGQGQGQFGGGSSINTSGGYGAVNTAPEIAAFGGPGHLGFADFYDEGGGGVGTPPNRHVFVYLYGTGGANTFSQTADLFPGPTGDPHGFAAGDFDGDGKADLVMHSVNPERLWFYKGNGNGTFQPPTASSPGIQNLFSAATADLNGDGHLDLIFGTYGAIIVMLGNGDGTFGQPAYYSVPGGNAQSLSVADFNADGHLDVAVAGAVDAVVLPGVGDGTFGPALTFATGFHGGTAYVHAADLNGDGRPDLVFSAGGEGDGNVHFSVLLNAAPPVSHLLWNNANGTASIWNYDPASGTYTFHNFGPFAGYTAKTIADGPDGKVRVLWTKADGTASIWNLDNGTGTYTYHNFGPYPGFAAKALSVGPDNITHILWDSTDGHASFWNYNAAAGTYTFHNFGPYPGFTASAIADGPDGKVRVIWNSANGTASIWSLDNVAGTFTFHNFGPFAGYTATAVSVGTDGTTHLLWNSTNGTASIWNYNTATGSYTYHNYGPYAGYAAKTIADGMDGRLGVLWDSTGGIASVWSLDNVAGTYTFHNFGPFAGYTATDLSAGY